MKEKAKFLLDIEITKSQVKRDKKYFNFLIHKNDNYSTL